MNTGTVASERGAVWHVAVETIVSDNGRSTTVCADVIERIKALIASGECKPGRRLPSERELAEDLGVSRPSVREALRTLSVMGVLETRHGSGTQIASTSANVLRSSFDFLMLLDQPTVYELYEARELIEAYLAERAAERRTDADLAEIESALRDMRSAGLDPDGMTDPNVRFHTAVAAAARTPVLGRFMDCLHDGVRACIEATRAGVLDWAGSYDLHFQIYDAIRRKSPTDARRAMILHMANAVEELRRAEGL